MPPSDSETLDIVRQIEIAARMQLQSLEALLEVIRKLHDSISFQTYLDNPDD